MTIINPKQVAHLKKMQPNFKFKERNIEPSLDIATTKELLDNMQDEVEMNILKGKQIGATDAATHVHKENSPIHTPKPSTGIPSKTNASDGVNGSEEEEQQSNVLTMTPEDQMFLIRLKWMSDKLLVPIETVFNDTRLETVEGCVLRS